MHAHKYWKSTEETYANQESETEKQVAPKSQWITKSTASR